MNLYHELGLNVQSPGLVVACTQWSNPCRNAAVVRVQVIRHARAHDVGKSQSCMNVNQRKASSSSCASAGLLAINARSCALLFFLFRRWGSAPASSSSLTTSVCPVYRSHARRVATTEWLVSGTGAFPYNP